MVSYSKELAEIKELLEKNPQGMTITDISKALNVYRKTTAKYLDMLLITGQVEMRPFGPVKIYTPSRRVPVSSMMDLSRDHIMVFDRDLTIAEVNEPVLEVNGISREDITGSSFDACPLPVSGNERIREMLSDGLAGKEFSGEVHETIVSGRTLSSIRILPMTFDDGTSGVALVILNDEEMKECQADLGRRDTLLNALAHLTSYRPDDGPQVSYLERSLKTLASGLNASRVYLSRNEEDFDGHLSHRRVVGWDAPGIEELPGGGPDRGMRYSMSGKRMRDTLARGRVYFGNTDDLPEEEKRMWDGTGIVSFALAPVFRNGAWWGYLGTEQWERPWEWSRGEMEGLTTAAGIIGMIIDITEPEDPVE